MTTVSPTSNTPLTLDQVNQDSLGSLEKVLNTLSGKKVDLNNAGSMKISEEVLFAANLYKELEGKSSSLAKNFLSNLKEFITKSVKDSGRPILTAAKSAFDKVVKGKKIFESNGDVQRQAYSKAQLDTSDSVSNRSKSVNFTVEGTRAGMNVSKEELRSDYREALNTAKELKPTTFTTMKNSINRMIKSAKPPVKPETPKVPAETVKPVENPPVNTVTPPVEVSKPLPPVVVFVEKPNEIEVDGMIRTGTQFPTLRIPTKWNDEVEKVVLVDTYEKAIGEATKDSRDSVGRDKYIYKGSGAENIKSYYVTFTDGTYLKLTPEDKNKGMHSAMY